MKLAAQFGSVSPVSCLSRYPVKLVDISGILPVQQISVKVGFRPG